MSKVAFLRAKLSTQYGSGISTEVQRSSIRGSVGSWIARGELSCWPRFMIGGLLVAVSLQSSACRNTDSCCGLDPGEVYEIELMSEVEVEPYLRDCSRFLTESGAAVGDTLRVEIVSLKYDERQDCSNVRKVRLLAATPDSFAPSIGTDVADGAAAIRGLYYIILGGFGSLPDSSERSLSFQWALVAKGCDGVDEEFDPQAPKLAFSDQDGQCQEAWAAKLTRVEEGE